MANHVVNEEAHETSERKMVAGNFCSSFSDRGDIAERICGGNTQRARDVVVWESRPVHADYYDFRKERVEERVTTEMS